MQRRVNFSRHGVTLTVQSCMFMQLHREKDRQQITSFLLCAIKQRGMAPVPLKIPGSISFLQLYDVIGFARGRIQRSDVVVQVVVAVRGDIDIDERIALAARTWRRRCRIQHLAVRRTQAPASSNIQFRTRMASLRAVHCSFRAQPARAFTHRTPVAPPSHWSVTT